MTDDELKQIEERAGKAMPGPWVFAYPAGAVTSSGSVVLAACRVEDAEFATHAREDVPALVAEVRRLNALLEERFTVSEIADHLFHGIRFGGVAGVDGRSLTAELHKARERVERKKGWPHALTLPAASKA